MTAQIRDALLKVLSDPRNPQTQGPDRRGLLADVTPAKSMDAVDDIPAGAQVLSDNEVLPEGEKWPGQDDETKFQVQNELIKEQQLNAIIDKIMDKGYRAQPDKTGGSVSLTTATGAPVNSKKAFEDPELMKLVLDLMQNWKEPATPENVPTLKPDKKPVDTNLTSGGSPAWSLKARSK